MNVYYALKLYNIEVHLVNINCRYFAFTNIFWNSRDNSINTVLSAMNGKKLNLYICIFKLTHIFAIYMSARHKTYVF